MRFLGIFRNALEIRLDRWAFFDQEEGMEIAKVAYGVSIEKAGNRFVVTFPDFPEARAEADDFAGAFDIASRCIEETLAERIRKNQAIPAPSLVLGCKVTPGAAIAAKALLHKILRENGKTPTDLAAKLGKGEKEVLALLDPDCTSNPAELSAAIEALGVKLAMAACSIRVGG